MKSSFPLKCIAIILFTVFLSATILSSVMLVFGIASGVFTDEQKQQEMKIDMLEDTFISNIEEFKRNIHPRSEYYGNISRNIMFEILDSEDKVLYSNIVDEKVLLSYSTPFTVQEYIEIETELETEVDDNETDIESTTLYQDEYNHVLIKYDYTIKAHLKENFVEKDGYYYLSEVFDLVANNQAKINTTLVVSLVMTIVSLIFFMCFAGHKDDTEEIHISKFDKIPFEIILAVLVAVAVGILALCVWTIDIIFDNFSFYDDFVVIATPYMIAFAFILLFVFAFTLAMVLYTTAVRVKSSTFIKSTIVYKIFKLCLAIIKGFFKIIKKLCKAGGHFISKIPLVWKLVVAIAVITFVECLIFAIDWGYWWPTVWIINIILGIGLILIAILLKRIKKGTEEIAQGNIYKKIDTQYMFGEVKQHAENINNINDGIAKAVEERMKSERFKTELITNVSHDIKTPLTSIINYVDLLEKEEIENDIAKEYISVLSRQSARLKKLIEDLIDASKASTGNMTVNFTSFELGILLAQAIGEYEERMKKSNLDIVLRKPETPVYIVADSRHIWRIFDNILNNIIKYSQPNTRVYIDVEQVGKYAEICFKNISMDELNVTGDELMERFVRGDSSRNTEGSGLGLSIAKSLAELQKGKLKIEIDGDLFKVKIAFSIA